MGEGIGGFGVAGFAEAPGASDFLEHGAFAGLVAVQFEAEVTEALALEPALDDFEGGEFFGDEEDLFAVEDGGGDDVGDALAFAGAGGPVEDEVAALADHFDGEGLGGVGIDDVVEAVDGDQFIEVGGVGDGLGLGREAGGEEGGEEGAVEEGAIGGPGLGGEVAVEEEFGEGEAAEDDGVGEDLPGRVIGDGEGDLVEVGGGVEVVGVGEGGQGDAEVGFQFGAEGEVFLDVLLTGPELEAVAGAAAGEVDGDEEERGVARGVGGFGFEPFQLAEGEVEDVDAGFLEGGLGVAGEVEQAALEDFRGEAGLEAGVGVPFGEAGGGVGGIVDGREGGFLVGGWGRVQGVGRELGSGSGRRRRRRGFSGWGGGGGRIGGGEGRGCGGEGGLGWCGGGGGGREDGGLGVGGWEEGEGFSFGDEAAEDLGSAFVVGGDEAGVAGCQGNREEAVPVGQVEQLASGAVEGGDEGSG